MISEHLRKAIEDVVHDGIHSVDIARIDVQEDTDYRGEDVLRVRIVFDGKTLDPKETVRLGYIVRKKLLELDEMRIPHTSYISKADARRIPAA